MFLKIIEILIAGRLTERPSLFGKKKKNVKESHKSHKRLKLTKQKKTLPKNYVRFQIMINRVCLLIC